MTTRQSVSSFGNDLLQLLNVLYQQKQLRDAQEQFKTGFTTTPVMGNPATIQVQGQGTTAQLPRFLGTQQQPDVQKMVQFLASNNPQLQQMAGNYLQGQQVVQGLQKGQQDLQRGQYMPVQSNTGMMNINTGQINVPLREPKVVEGAQGQLLQFDPMNPSGTVRQITAPVIKPENAYRPRLDANGQPITQRFGNEIRTVYDEYQNGKPTGNWKYEAGGSMPMPPDLSKLKSSIVDKFNADPNVRKQVQAKNAALQIQELLDSHNPVADNSIPTFMARASGEVGNLSEADKAPFGGSQSLIQKINRTVQKAATGNLDDTDRQFVSQLAQTMATHSDKILDATAKSRAQQYSRANKNLDQNELYQILSPTMGTQPTSQEEKSLNGKNYIKINGQWYEK